MASLTVRKLDEAIKTELRLRAARNGRSVEDEVRVILRDAAQHKLAEARTTPSMPQSAPPPPRLRDSMARGQLRVTLIIAGEIGRAHV